MSDKEMVMEQWAGHYKANGSNKVWAGAYTEDGVYMACWGRLGSALSSKATPMSSMETAAKEYKKKVSEKQKEGYLEVGFDDSQYGIRSFGPMLSSGVNAQKRPTVTPPPPVYTCAHVTPISYEEALALIGSASYGLTEKVNGERCLIASCGLELTAYNRRGLAVQAVPQAALSLLELGVSFLIDGERLTGEDSGAFVAFDLMEWDGRDIRSWPYQERIALLEDKMRLAGLIESGGATKRDCVTYVPGLSLLVARPDKVLNEHAINQIKEENGEGIILRNIFAPYESGESKHIRKFKFLDDLDAVVLGIKPGITGSGSLIMGLVRPEDGAIIEVGCVRSGLTNSDVNEIAGMLARGEQPVLRVEYLPVRTIGITLVEARTKMEWLRGDKLAGECTTDQLGPQKADMVAQAKATDLPIRKSKRAEFNLSVIASSVA